MREPSLRSSASNIGRRRAEIKAQYAVARHHRADWRRRAVVGAVLALSLAVFFRDALASRLTLLYGDGYDGLIEVAILDHWYAIVAHGAAWNVTGWFAPHPDTLGYNDTFIIPGAFFTVARAAGADPFVATFASHVAMKAIGFLGMYALLRRGLMVSTPLALAGAAIFATANASLLHMHHAQLLAVGVTPWLMLGATGAVRAALADDRRSLWRNGLAFAPLFGIAALNAFYQVWFLGFFTLLFVPIALTIAGRERRGLLRRALRRHWPVLAALGVITAVALIPLAVVYAPKLAEGDRHPWDPAIMGHLPIVSTYFNVGAGNLVWGRILPMASFHGGEYRFGLPLGLLATTVAAAVESARHRSDARIGLALGVTLGVSALLMTRWTDHGSLWWLVYLTVPGAAAIRVVTRFLLFALIPMIAASMMLLDRWPRRRVWIAPIIAFLLVEQVQLAAPLTLNRAVQLRMLTGAQAPPPECDAFFVVSARSPPDRVIDEADRIAAAWDVPGGARLADLYRHNVDAMVLASYTDRPTINGFSTFNPPDWNLAAPDDADYLSRVGAYAARHRIGRLCGLDRRRRPQWFAFDQALGATAVTSR